MSPFEGSRTPNIFHHQKNTIFTKPKWPSSRRSHSLSSSPSISSGSSSSFRSFSIEDDSPPPSPSQRIPFSWESIPGIPKHQIIKRVNSDLRNNNSNYLPLPPLPAAISSSKPNFNKKKHIVSRRNNNDPFFQALVECSKSGDEEDDEDKDMFGSFLKGPAKGLSHRFGFVNSSCKNTCTVAESLVLLPREQPRRISYGVVKKRSG